MNINFKQVLSILGAILGVLMISTSQLTDLFGAGLAHKIVSVAALLTTSINSVLAVVTGQAAMVKDVRAMDGVERIQVNKNANPTLAAIAVDPNEPKVGGTTPEVQTALQNIAKG